MTLTCTHCGLEAEPTTHKGEFAAACPNCEEILFRPVGDGLGDAAQRVRALLGSESR